MSAEPGRPTPRSNERLQTGQITHGEVDQAPFVVADLVAEDLDVNLPGDARRIRIRLSDVEAFFLE